MLSDRDLHGLLSQMDFQTDEPARPFEPKKQVQPCSIDLRLDRCFWRPRRPKGRATLDLRQPQAGQIEVSRLFRSHWCSAGEGIALAPGEMVLGRTFEKFTFPNGFAGRIHGRSSYARLGLSVHCTGDFINPGYRGRMPLQLVNHGPVPIVLAPYMHVCQLVVIPTSSLSDVPYGTGTVEHTYMNDDGGPSRYWRDRGLQVLQGAIQDSPFDQVIRQRLLDVVGKRDVETIDRFASYLRWLPSAEITSAREVTERFARRDTRRYDWMSRGLKVAKWACFLPVSLSLGAIFKQPYGTLHHWVWAITAALLIPGVWANFFARDPAEPVTTDQVEEAFPPTA